MDDNNHNYHHLKFLANRELDELYISIALRYFGLSMISIFVPIYLIKLDYSLFSVLLFLGLSNLVHALFVIPAAKVASRFGCKHTILFSIPVTILFFFMLYSLEAYHWSIYLLALVKGIYNSHYWLGYHVDFSTFTDKKNRGSEIGFANIVSTIVHVLGPTIGGFILVFLGFKLLFIFVSVLLVLSAIPLFFSKDGHSAFNFSIAGIFKGRKIRDYVGFSAYAVEGGINMAIWPLYIFFAVLNNYSTLGLVSSLSLFTSLIFSFFIGRWTDIKRKLLLKIGSFLNAIVWVIRIMVTTSLQVFAVNSLYGITQTLVNIPFEAICYDKAHKQGLFKFIIFREIVINLGRGLFYVVIAVISSLVIGLVFGGGASLLLFFFAL